MVVPSHFRTKYQLYPWHSGSQFICCMHVVLQVCLYIHITYVPSHVRDSFRAEYRMTTRLGASGDLPCKYNQLITVSAHDTIRYLSLIETCAVASYDWRKVPLLECVDRLRIIDVFVHCGVPAFLKVLNYGALIWRWECRPSPVAPLSTGNTQRQQTEQLVSCQNWTCCQRCHVLTSIGLREARCTCT